jgi:protein gp37
MSEKTNISWCDSTVNFFSGCTKISAGCLNCYAEARDNRHMQEKVSHWGKGAPRLKHKGAVKDALALNRKPWICDLCGHASASNRRDNGSCLNSECDYHKGKMGSFHRRRIFSLSLGDWLDEEAPIEWLAEMLDTVRQCDQVNWLLLTKRPENWHQLVNNAALSFVKQHDDSVSRPFVNWIYDWQKGMPPQNIWLGTSTENQERADKRIRELLQIPAAVRFLSVEPMLGPIRFNPVTLGWNEIHWMIFGGESGKGARPCNVEWIRDGVEQCKAAGVAAFVKQLGAEPVEDGFEHSPECRDEHCSLAGGIDDCDGQVIDIKLELKDTKGGDVTEWPQDLQVREFPTPPTP